MAAAETRHRFRTVELACRRGTWIVRGLHQARFWCLGPGTRVRRSSGEALRHVWNARGAANIARLEISCERRTMLRQLEMIR